MESDVFQVIITKGKWLGCELVLGITDGCLQRGERVTVAALLSWRSFRRV